MTEISREEIQLRVSDGTTMAAFVARPSAAGRSAAVMVFQEAYGVNAHIRDVAERFAKLGLVAVAPELFHRTAPGFVGNYEDFGSVKPHLSALTNEGIDADVESTFHWLLEDRGTDPGRIGAVGFCMGGRVAYLAASRVPLRCAVSFYGGNIAPANLGRAPELRAPMLFFWGGLDKNITPDLVSAVTAALRAAQKKYVSVEISDADHGFFCDARRVYNRTAAEYAWNLTTAFLKTHLFVASVP